MTELVAENALDIRDQVDAKETILAGFDRYLADGAHYADLVKISGRIENWDDWPVAWSDVARETEERAELTLATGAKLTAAAEFARASLYYHLSQYVVFHDMALKRELHDRKVGAFERAAPLLKSPPVRTDLDFKGARVPGYLRLPANVSNPPVVICLGGFDTTKEDYLTFTDLCVDRGMATYALDLPGQGEALFDDFLREDFDRIISAAIDHLESRTDIDATRIGIIGRSLGGFFAPKAAAVDKRLKALVCWGAVYDIQEPNKVTDRKGYIRLGLTYMAGAQTSEEADQFYRWMNLRGFADKIDCPTLVVHGGRDHGTPMINVERLLEDLKGNSQVQTLIQPDAVHCNHNYSHIARPAMADFLSQALKRAG